MRNEMPPIDITNTPELAELAEEVRRTKQPRVLRLAREDVAMIVPVPSKRAKKVRTWAPTKADYEAFLASAGSWADVDTDAFLKANAESRARSTKPPVQL